MLKSAYEHLIERIRKDNQSTVNDYHKTPSRIQYWFSKGSYDTLSIIYEAILQEEDRDIQKFFICALSHCLKNSSRWLMKSIKPTIDSNKKEIDVSKTFLRHLTKMMNKNSVFYNHLKETKQLSLSSKMDLRDITEKKGINQKADLIITSPPYVTSYEYGDLHQLILLWLGHKNYEDWGKYIQDFKSFKSSFIGSNIHSDRPPKNELSSEIALDIIGKIEKINKSLAHKISNYYSRMNIAFQTMHALLKEDKKACIIIGNTKIRGVPILNAHVALEQLLNLEFKKDVLIKRNANINKMIPSYRDKKNGKFTSKENKNKTIAYHEEYILKVKKK